jgi:hypothetical protein
MKIFMSSCVSVKKNNALKFLLLLGPIVAFQLIASGRWAAQCLFHHWTGLPCPSCGTTRCLQLLLSGQLADAWHMQPLTCCAALVLGTLCIYSVLGSVFKWPALRVVLTHRRERWVLALFSIAVVFGNWFFLMLNH